MKTIRTLSRLIAGLCAGLFVTLAASAQAAPPCWPANVGGSGSQWLYSHNDKGQWIGWWCPDGRPYGAVALRSYSIKHPSGPHASASDMLSAYWALNVGTVTPETSALWGEMMFALPSIEPPAPAAPAPWTVATNGSYTTRPAYPVIDGAVGTKEAGRAPVGQPCDCNAPINRGSTTYCAAPGLPALVTVCRQ